MSDKNKILNLLAMILLAISISACGKSETQDVQARRSVQDVPKSSPVQANVDSNQPSNQSALPDAFSSVSQSWEKDRAEERALEEKKMLRDTAINRENNNAAYKSQQLDVMGTLFTSTIMMEGFRDAMPGKRCREKTDNLKDILHEAEKSIGENPASPTVTKVKGKKETTSGNSVT